MTVRGILLIIHTMSAGALRTMRLRRMKNGINSASCWHGSHILGSRERMGKASESLDDLIANVDNLLFDLSTSPGVTQLSQDRGWAKVDFDSIYVEGVNYSNHIFKVANKEDLIPISFPDKPSPIETVFVRNRLVYLKRDDLLRLKGSNVSGNKARKLLGLNQIPAQDFPDCVVSHGGPQSNAMVALAAIVHSKNVELKGETVESIQAGEAITIENFLTASEFSRKHEAQNGTVDTDQGANKVTQLKRFVYYTKKLPRFLRANPNGNLFRAKLLGMELVELSNKDYMAHFGGESGGKPEAPPGLDPPIPGRSLWIPQGGACQVAVSGGRMLASEIVYFWQAQGQGRPLSVCVPGGTCTTALILHQEIHNLLDQMLVAMDIQVIVIPCVGDDAYARRQMMALSIENRGIGLSSEIPTVLNPSALGSSYFGQASTELKYFSFGKPDAALLETFSEMSNDCGVVLDLLYGCPAWAVLLRHWRSSSSPTTAFDESDPIAGREIMYVHSGGLEGVNSQLLRYKHEGLVHDDEIQPPSESRSGRAQREA